MNNFRRAFTLVELLLALSIFSMAAVCVYGTFWAGVRINQRSEGENAAYRQIRLALDLMSVDLENAVPYDFTNSYPDQTAFQGEDDAITFLLASGKGLKVIRYYLDSAQQGRVHKVVIGATHTRNVDAVADYREQEVPLRDLVREEWDFPDYLSGTTGEHHAAEVIATDVAENSLKFFYGYLLNPAGGEDTQMGDAYEWREKWTQGDVPLMVRIEMDFFLTGPARRMVVMRKDVFIPPGSWGKPEKI